MKVSSLITLLGLAMAVSAAPAPKNQKNNNKAATAASSGAGTAVDPADPCLTPEVATPIDGKAPPGAVAGGQDANAQIIDARALRRAAACNAGAANQATNTGQQAATPVDPEDPGLTAETAAPIDGKAPPGAVAGGQDACAQIINARGAGAAESQACLQKQQGANANGNDQNKGAAVGAQAGKKGKKGKKGKEGKKGKKGKKGQKGQNKGAAAGAAAGAAGGAAGGAANQQQQANQNAGATSASATSAPAQATPSASNAGPIDAADPGLVAEVASPIDGKAPPGAVAGGQDANAQIIDA